MFTFFQVQLKFIEGETKREGRVWIERERGGGRRELRIIERDRGKRWDGGKERGRGNVGREIKRWMKLERYHGGR